MTVQATEQLTTVSDASACVARGSHSAGAASDAAGLRRSDPEAWTKTCADCAGGQAAHNSLKAGARNPEALTPQAQPQALYFPSGSDP